MVGLGGGVGDVGVGNVKDVRFIYEFIWICFWVFRNFWRKMGVV